MFLCYIPGKHGDSPSASFSSRRNSRDSPHVRQYPPWSSATTGRPRGQSPWSTGLGRANTWVRPYIIGGPTSDFRLPISDLRSNVPLPAVLLNFSGHGTVNTSPYPPPIPGQCRDLRNFRCLLIRQLLLLK